jgi:6-phosphofructokinase 1
VILIPEIPFDYDAIVAKIEERERDGKHFAVVIIAEGTRERGGAYVTSGDGGQDGEAKLGGIGHIVADQIQARTGKESRAMVLGHLQRGGSPTAWDRQLCTRFGLFAVEMVTDAD